MRGRRRTALSAPAPKGTGRVWWCIRSCWARSCGPFCPICPGWSRGSAFWCGALWPSVRQRPAAGSLGCSSGSPRIGRRPGTGPAPPILDWHLTKILHFLRCRRPSYEAAAFFGKIDRFFKWDILFFSYHSFFVVVTSTKNVLALCWNCVMLYMKRAKRSPFPEMKGIRQILTKHTHISIRRNECNEQVYRPSSGRVPSEECRRA